MGSRCAERPVLDGARAHVLREPELDTGKNPFKRWKNEGKAGAGNLGRQDAKLGVQAEAAPAMQSKDAIKVNRGRVEAKQSWHGAARKARRVVIKCGLGAVAPYPARWTFFSGPLVFYPDD